MLPFTLAAELLHDIYGLSISPGTLVARVGEARAAPQDTANQIDGNLHIAALVNADESGLRIAGKLHWLHIAANETLTYYGVREKRGMAAIEAHGILPKRIGVLVHDCWAPYWKLDGSTHALCNAHLLRKLVYMKEITGQAWPDAMTNLLLGANKLCDAARKKQMPFSADDVAAFRTLYDAVVYDGKQLNPEAVKTAGRQGPVKQSIAQLVYELEQLPDQLSEATAYLAQSQGAATEKATKRKIKDVAAFVAKDVAVVNAVAKLDAVTDEFSAATAAAAAAARGFKVKSTKIRTVVTRIEPAQSPALEVIKKAKKVKKVIGPVEPKSTKKAKPELKVVEKFAAEAKPKAAKKAS